MAAEPFRHLHIPLDANAGPQCFINNNALLYEDERVLAVVRQTTNQSFGQVEMDKPVQREDVVQSMLGLVARYRHGGFDAVAAMVASNVPANKREELLEACFKVSQTLPGELYLELLADEGVDIEQGFSAKEGLFLGEALAGSVYAYGRYQSLLDGYETGILFGTDRFVSHPVCLSRREYVFVGTAFLRRTLKQITEATHEENFWSTGAGAGNAVRSGSCRRRG